MPQLSSDATVILALVLFLVIVGLCSVFMVILFKLRKSKEGPEESWGPYGNNDYGIEERNVGFLKYEHVSLSSIVSPVDKEDVAFVKPLTKKITKSWRTFFPKKIEIETHELNNLPPKYTKTKNFLPAVGKRLFGKKGNKLGESTITEISSIITPGSSNKQIPTPSELPANFNYLKRLPGTDSESPASRAPYIEEESLEIPLRPFSTFKVESAKKLRYSIAVLFDLQPNFTYSAPLCKVRISELFNKKAIHEPMPAKQNLANLNCASCLLGSESPEVRCLGYLALVGCGSYESLFASPVHFEKTFCDSVVQSINTLKIYRDTVKYPVLQSMLLNLALCFVWEQWNSATFGQQRTSEILLTNNERLKLEKNCPGDGYFLTQSSVLTGVDRHVGRSKDTLQGSFVRNEDSFEEINLGFEGYSYDSAQMNTANDADTVIISSDNNHHRQRNLTMLPPNETFLLLCNLYLGSPDIEINSRTQFTLKLNGVIKACARRCPCHQHRAILPLVMHSIHATQRKYIINFFYEILLEILQAHISCCFVPADLFAANSPVQTLVQEGLLPHQPTPVKEKAITAKNLVSNNFPKARLWGAPQHVAEDQPQVRAPGAWSWSA